MKPPFGIVFFEKPPYANLIMAKQSKTTQTTFKNRNPWTELSNMFVFESFNSISSHTILNKQYIRILPGVRGQKMSHGWRDRFGSTRRTGAPWTARCWLRGFKVSSGKKKPKWGDTVDGSNMVKIAHYLYPIVSMYGIFSYIYHKNQPNVGIYTIHGSCGYRVVVSKIFIFTQQNWGNDPIWL